MKKFSLILLIFAMACGKEEKKVEQITYVQPPNPADIASIIDPCGDAPGVYDEVLLKLVSGQVVASFSDSASGTNTRFSLLPAGTYVTTDGSNCHFNVDVAGNVTW